MTTQPSEATDFSEGVPPNAPLVLGLRPTEAAHALGFSRRKLWELTNRGEIPHVKIDKVTVYPVAALRQWLEERTEQAKP